MLLKHTSGAEREYARALQLKRSVGFLPMTPKIRLPAIIILIALTMGIAPLCKAQNVKTRKMPKEELEELMNARLPFAQKMLSEHGEFYPYGGAINSSGDVVAIAAYDGDEHPPSQKLIDLLVELFRVEAKAGTYRATAIIFDVRVIPPKSGQKTDAIRIDLDHVDDLSLTLFLPYRIMEKGEVVYGEMFAQAGSAKIFKKP